MSLKWFRWTPYLKDIRFSRKVWDCEFAWKISNHGLVWNPFFHSSATRLVISWTWASVFHIELENDFLRNVFIFKNENNDLVHFGVLLISKVYTYLKTWKEKRKKKTLTFPKNDWILKYLQKRFQNLLPNAYPMLYSFFQFLEIESSSYFHEENNP